MGFPWLLSLFIFWQFAAPSIAEDYDNINTNENLIAINGTVNEETTTTTTTTTTTPPPPPPPPGAPPASGWRTTLFPKLTFPTRA